MVYSEAFPNEDPFDDQCQGTELFFQQIEHLLNNSEVRNDPLYRRLEFENDNQNAPIEIEDDD
jgi:hypothetical protein